jgi:hypothetical protein
LWGKGGRCEHPGSPGPDGRGSHESGRRSPISWAGQLRLQPEVWDAGGKEDPSDQSADEVSAVLGYVSKVFRDVGIMNPVTGPIRD